MRRFCVLRGDLDDRLVLADKFVVFGGCLTFTTAIGDGEEVDVACFPAGEWTGVVEVGGDE